QEVGGFDILVNDLVLMGIIQCGSCLTDKKDNVLWREQFGAAALSQPGRERAFRAVGHDHVGEYVFLHVHLAVVVEGQDVWVVEQGDSSDFALEETACFPGGGAVGIGGGFG